MPSEPLKAFNAFAKQGLKPTFNTNFDPVAYRGVLAVEPVLEKESTFRALQHSRIEMRPDAAQARLVVYVAGGGFCFDANDTHRSFVDEIAGALGADGCLIRYRLAPEHPFPAALEDVSEALDLLLTERGPENVVVIGDSAGAALILSSLVARLSRSRPGPARLVLLSALTDMAMTGLSHVPNAEADPMFGPQAIIHKAHHYLQGANPTLPEASPYWGDVVGLPPCLFLVGDTEVMLDDSRRFVEKALNSAVDARLQIYPEAPHTMPLMADLPEAAQARQDILAFLREVWPASAPISD